MTDERDKALYPWEEPPAVPAPLPRGSGEQITRLAAQHGYHLAEATTAPLPPARWEDDMRWSAPGSVEITTIGGPLDRVPFYHPPNEELQDWRMVEVVLADGSDEPYILRKVTDAEGQIVEWWLVWSMLMRPSFRDPDPGTVAAMAGMHAEAGGTMITQVCAVGEHDWAPTRTSPGGNKVRHCNRCGLSQGLIF